MGIVKIHMGNLDQQIQFQVINANMDKSASGSEIIRLVEGLSDKIKRYEKDNIKLFGDGSAVPLNNIEFVKVKEQVKKVEKKREDEGLQVTIESKMLSLESGELEGRDPRTTEG